MSLQVAMPETREQLQLPQPTSDAPGIPSALWEKLEKMVREQVSAVGGCLLLHLPLEPPWEAPLSDVAAQQGTAQGSLEPPQPSERTRLLSEIQALRAQLRLTHLQNQEKLQHLCTALTSTEARGSQREHQLRRQGGCGPAIPPCSHEQFWGHLGLQHSAGFTTQVPDKPGSTVSPGREVGPCGQRWVCTPCVGSTGPQLRAWNYFLGC